MAVRRTRFPRVDYRALVELKLPKERGASKKQDDIHDVEVTERDQQNYCVQIHYLGSRSDRDWYEILMKSLRVPI